MRVWIFLLLFSSVTYAITINEVMYDPSDSDTDREWIEIYNNDNETYNISGWKLVTDGNHNLVTNSSNEIFGNGTYFVIVQDIPSFMIDYPSFNGTLVDSSWTGLTRSNETIAIKNSSVVFDNTTYEPVAAEGNSICRNGTSFFECNPTPGYENAFLMNQTVNQTNTTDIYSNPSRITITGIENAKFGESAMIDLEVYRNSTGDYAIKLYVLSRDEKLSYISTVHAETKNLTYKFSVPVQIKSNCDNKYSEGSYKLVAEGLDIRNESDILISGFSSNCKTITVSAGNSGGGGGCAPAAKESSYSVGYPLTVVIGEEFNTTLRFVATKKTYTFYSYVYRGNTPISEGYDGVKWSGSWSANAQSLSADIGKNYTIVLPSRIEADAQPGIYSLRVKIKSDKEEDVTNEIRVAEPVKTAVIKENETAKIVPLPPVTGSAVKDPTLVSLIAAILRLFRV